MRRRDSRRNADRVRLVHADGRRRALRSPHRRGGHLRSQAGRGDQRPAPQKTFNYISTNFNDADPSVAKFTNTWAVENFSGYVDSPYPTQNSIFNTGGSFNSGAYTDPKMDQLINASVFGTDPNAVTKEASYETEALPGALLAQLRLHLGRLKAGWRIAGLVPQPDAVRALAPVLVGQQEVGVGPRTASARTDARIHHPPDPHRGRDHDRDRGDHVRDPAPDRR